MAPGTRWKPTSGTVAAIEVRLGDESRRLGREASHCELRDQMLTVRGMLCEAARLIEYRNVVSSPRTGISP